MKVTQNRLDLMTTVTIDGVQEKDPLSVSFREFVPKREMRRHQTLSSQVRRPDIIAQEQYQSSGFWWWILGVNGIVDPYEVPVDFTLNIPDTLDFYDWFREQKDEKET